MPDEPSFTNESNGKNRLNPKVSSALAYSLLILSGVIFYATSKNNDVRFHSIQSILFSAAIAAIYLVLEILIFILPLLSVVYPLVWIGFFALWIFLMIKAYQGEKFKLPFISEIAEKYGK